MGRRSEKIKGRKEAQNKVKTKIFSVIGKKIVAAVRRGGVDVSCNKDLQVALDLARRYNYSKENIQRSIAKAMNPQESNYKQVVFELYGWGGVGILVETWTDNVNRTSGDVRAVVNKHGIKLAEPGSLTFKFCKKGRILLRNEDESVEDRLLLDVAEAGGEDCVKSWQHNLETESDSLVFQILCDPKNLEYVASSLQTKSYKELEKDFVYVPLSYVDCDKDSYASNYNIIETFEEMDDVEAVYTDMKDNQ
ncbi:Probable transcriptional regulatory protein [Galdieria sulphuraria]|nr:Probable transcriptional regulatory protein [Galdieria sulphuraria]